jgi:type IV secretory pathway TrbD component
LPGLLLWLLSTLLLRSFAAAEPSLADTELQHLHLMLYPCYLLRLQGWDVSSWVV